MLKHSGMKVLIILGLSALAAQATPLNLTQMFPDILVTSNVVTYDAVTDLFSATGRPLTLTLPGPVVHNITTTTTTSYTLNATIDDTGAATAGTLSVGGKIAALGATSGTLLTGTLAAFGNSAAVNGDPFEFIFTVTGGDLASLITPQAGVIISAKSTTYAGWTQSFISGSGATNDTFIVPEPACLGMLVMAGLPLIRRRH